MLKNVTRVSLISFLWLVLALVALVPTLNADEEITAALTSSQAELNVGDVVRLTLEVIHPAGYQLFPVQLGETWGEFEVRSVSTVDVSSNDDGSETSRQMIDVTLWAPGSYTTPSMLINVSDVNGHSHEISVESLSLTVNSVLIEGDDELRDIKPQASLPLPLVWPWVLAGLLLATLVAALIWRTIRGRWANRQDAPGALPDLRPAFQIALDELARIEQLDLPAAGRFKEQYTLVTDVLRNYLESAYDVSAMDRTTYEIRRALRAIDMTPPQKTDLVKLLGEADLVKFAKVIPEIDLVQHYPEDARQFVLETRPQPVAPPPDGEETGLSEVAA
jgi:hypothetical protein